MESISNLLTVSANIRYYLNPDDRKTIIKSVTVDCPKGLEYRKKGDFLRKFIYKIMTSYKGVDIRILRKGFLGPQERV